MLCGIIIRIKNNHMSNFFVLNWKDVLGALVSAVLSGVLLYVASLATVADLDLMKVLDIAVIVGAASLLKSLGTTKDGKFAGVVKVK